MDNSNGANLLHRVAQLRAGGVDAILPVDDGVITGVQAEEELPAEPRERGGVRLQVTVSYDSDADSIKVDISGPWSTWEVPPTEGIYREERPFSGTHGGADHAARWILDDLKRRRGALRAFLSKDRFPRREYAPAAPSALAEARPRRSSVGGSRPEYPERPEAVPAQHRYTLRDVRDSFG